MVFLEFQGTNFVAAFAFPTGLATCLLVAGLGSMDLWILLPPVSAFLFTKLMWLTSYPRMILGPLPPRKWSYWCWGDAGISFEPPGKPLSLPPVALIVSFLLLATR